MEETKLVDGKLVLVELGNFGLADGLPTTLVRTRDHVGFRLVPSSGPMNFQVRSLRSKQLPVVLSFQSYLGAGFQRVSSSQLRVISNDFRSVSQLLGGESIAIVARGKNDEDPVVLARDMVTAQRENDFATSVGVTFPEGPESGGFDVSELWPLDANFFAASDAAFTRIALTDKRSSGTSVHLYDTRTKKEVAALRPASTKTLSISKGLLVTIEYAVKAPYPCAIYRLSDGKLLRQLTAFCAG
ncbi:MAG: hypothetical protein ACHQ50_03790 [Fimbriimonadales bacterium]